MSKKADGPRGGFRERFRGARIHRRGGFEGDENVPPLKPDQVPLVVVDGVAVRPKIAATDSTPGRTDSETSSEPAGTRPS